MLGYTLERSMGIGVDPHHNTELLSCKVIAAKPPTDLWVSGDFYF